MQTGGLSTAQAEDRLKVRMRLNPIKGPNKSEKKCSSGKSEKKKILFRYVIRKKNVDAYLQASESPSLPVS